MELELLSNWLNCVNQKTKSLKKPPFLAWQLLLRSVYSIDVDEVQPDMKRKDLMDVLVVILHHEDNVEILDEAAFTLTNLIRDCIRD